MDAQVAYGFHHLRERAPQLTIGPISNKVKMALYSYYYLKLSRSVFTKNLWNPVIHDAS